MHEIKEHVGFIDVYLTDPEILFKFEHETKGLLGIFGCHSCTEQEVYDFARFRAALLCGCGQFDSELEYLVVTVTYDVESWVLRYNLRELNFEVWTETK